MRPKIIVGNWKMNTTLADAYILASGVKGAVEHIEQVQIVLCPPAIWLGLIAEHEISPREYDNLSLGAQNMYFKNSGPFTGEISPEMVREVAEYVILGHSERTHVFKESLELVAEKVQAAFEHGLKPILCIGEDDKSGRSLKLLAQRMNHLISNLSEEEVEDLIVAYEPVWAIGTGDPATPEYAQEAAMCLRQVTSPQTRILYGGSVETGNAKGFLAMPDVDGLLIGGTSLKLKDFLTICKYADDDMVKVGE